MSISVTMYMSSLFNNHYLLPDLSEDVHNRWVMVGNGLAIPSGYGQVLG